MTKFYGLTNKKKLIYLGEFDNNDDLWDFIENLRYNIVETFTREDLTNIVHVAHGFLSNP